MEQCGGPYDGDETSDNQLTFPIIIAEAEAQSLMKELENISAKRPQTHDLLCNMMDAFHIVLQEVYIYKLVEGIFYTYLLCETEGEMVSLDSRASDAVIIALKKGCPVYVDSSVLEKVGLPSASIGNEEEEAEALNAGFVAATDPGAAGDYSRKSLDELSALLQDAVDIEDYELASVIRDEMNSRQQKR